MSTRSSKPSRDGAESPHAQDSTEILTECCEQTAYVRVQLVHCDYSADGCLAARHDELVEIILPSGEGDKQLVEHAIGCVSFSHRASLCAFVGGLIDVRRNVQGQVRIVVTYPKQLMVTNLRQSFRVPVVEKSGLETKVRLSKTEEHAVIAHDITESGIEIEIPSGSPAILKVGSTIAIEMKFRGEVVRRGAEVRRVRENRCGIAFVHGEDENAQRLAARTRGIVLGLQQLWLKSRLE